MNKFKEFGKSSEHSVALDMQIAGLTRVASYVMSFPYDPMHGWSHDPGQAVAHSDNQKICGARVAYLLNQMNQIQEVGGTMLDNSIVYWGNEFGENDNNGGAHQAKNMTALVAGGGAGMLKMGYYINYANTGGMPFNNLLISFLNAMGLNSTDYERDGQPGIGQYAANAINTLGYANLVTTAARRQPLPFFYTGPVMG
jgi:hypothetical protein